MQHVDSDNNSSDYEAIFHDDFTDIDSSSDIEEIMNSDSDEENKLLYLTKMGYSEAKASITMEICDQITQRTFPLDAIGPPYFYYENMTLAPIGAWTKMSQHKVVPLKSDEVEMLLGFPKNHTRGVESARDMFPGSINVLSLFSMISDAEVVFYCLGIHLKIDVQEHSDQLEQLMSRFGEFNLVVDGIQCNNLTGRNKPH
ncbi:hypothetical protein F3Y22_tig00111338pilonHSYRG00313 [Hibiscus syriacus]|uniref:DNA (Cytosine-5)-methyltransferase DRM1/2 n=1 Tax=Hibiscus syriacus TaxID=106335 RepID=A0A6A2YPA3_HIBSY|nr:hypothetical protein F3Y22_tig00111338pilonHSYRG00313 [Hibiscus syriacus]